MMCRVPGHFVPGCLVPQAYDPAWGSAGRGRHQCLFCAGVLRRCEASEAIEMTRGRMAVCCGIPRPLQCICG